MKKIFILGFTFISVILLAGCDTAALPEMLTSELTSTEAIASLSYLSAGMLDTSSSDVVASNGSMFLANETETEPVTEVETELDDINVYIDQLKSFIENGPDQFGTITQSLSDRAEFTFMINVSVNDDAYVIYYNVDLVTGEISGIFVIGAVEYEITVTNSLSDASDLDDDDYDEEQDDEADQDSTDDEADYDSTDDEADYNDSADTDDLEEDTEENEQKMELIATNGLDTIKITYKVETEDEESTTKFQIEKDINGVQSEVEIKISIENDEYKLEIEDGDNKYKFKAETEEDGEVVYKLEYKVNGVEGEVKITVTINELGEEVYHYEISEDGKEHSVDKDEPDSDGFDQEDEHEDENENEDEQSA